MEFFRRRRRRRVSLPRVISVPSPKQDLPRLSRMSIANTPALSSLSPFRTGRGALPSPRRSSTFHAGPFVSFRSRRAHNLGLIARARSNSSVSKRDAEKFQARSAKVFHPAAFTTSLSRMFDLAGVALDVAPCREKITTVMITCETAARDRAGRYSRFINFKRFHKTRFADGHLFTTYRYHY